MITVILLGAASPSLDFTSPRTVVCCHVVDCVVEL
jgi:hypothetical protein